MRFARCSVIIASLLCIVIIFGCKITNTSLRDKYPNGGVCSVSWVNEHTVDLVSIGFPRTGETNVIKKKTQSKDAALLMAMAYARQHFSDAARDNGMILKVFYDNEENCALTYRLSGTSVQQYSKKKR